MMSNPGPMAMVPMGGPMSMVPVMQPAGGITYQNPNHNNYSMNMNFNPNINDKGPKPESWYKDGIDMGRKIGTQPKKDNDNIKEF